MVDFFEFSNEMLCVADSRGYLTRVNHAWTKTLGWSAEELTSRPYVDFVHPDDITATVREAQLLLTGTHETIYFENRYRCKDGSYRWLSWHATIAPGLDQLVAAARDVTTHKLQIEAIRSKQEWLRDLIEIQENEKRLLCQEFHDGLIQYAVGALMSLEGCQRNYSPSEVAAMIDAAIGNLRKGIEDGRRAIRGIRPAVLDDSGLEAAIDDLVDQFAPSGIMVTGECDPEIGQLPKSVQTAIYRVVQEALNNARKHSGTDVVRIDLKKSDGDLHLKVQDFGCGFDVESARKHGFGLRGMIERVRLLGGDCTIESEHDIGTQVSARLPIPTMDASDMTIVPAKPKD